MTQPLEHTFTAILCDRTSGSRGLAFSTLHAVRKALRSNRAYLVAPFLRSLQNTFPDMAAVLYVTNALLADESVATVDALIRRLADRSWLERALQVFGSEPRRVITLSNSSAVKALLYWARELVDEVACLRSLPGGEGAEACRRLEEMRVRVRLVEDDEADKLIRAGDLCLIGADMVCDEYIVNKVGSLRLARLCESAGACMIVAAGPMKRLTEESLSQYCIRGPFEKVPSRLVNILE